MGNKITDASVSSQGRSVPLWWESVTAESQRARDVFNHRAHKAHRVRTETNQKLEKHSNMRLSTGNGGKPYFLSSAGQVGFAPARDLCSPPGCTDICHSI